MDEICYRKSLGLNVREHRKRNLYTQSEFAKVCDIPREQIGRIERGEINTSVGNIFKIAIVLKIEPMDLFKNRDMFKF